MTKFCILVTLAILFFSSAVIAGSTPRQKLARSPVVIWGQSEPKPSPPAVSLAKYVPKPSGAPVLSSAWNLALPNLDGSFATPLVYRIPNTDDKIISFTSINGPLSGAKVLMCLLQASEEIFMKTVAMRQDGFIDKGRFTSEFLNGTTDYAIITVQDQVITGQKVTYGTLALVLRGLGQFMTAHNSFFEAAFNITDGRWGQVGYGSIIGNRLTATS